MLIVPFASNTRNRLIRTWYTASRGSVPGRAGLNRRVPRYRRSMAQYEDFVRHVLAEGEPKSDRTGTGTRARSGIRCASTSASASRS